MLRRIPFRRKPKKDSLSALVSKLDAVFSQYIRLRDASPDGTFVCISCGKRKSLRDAQCGHYFSRSNMSTRFDEDNCHAECVSCNCFDQKHLKGYYKSLIMKIGQERFLALEEKAKQMKKWSHYELEELIAYYKEEVRRIRE